MLQIIYNECIYNAFITLIKKCNSIKQFSLYTHTILRKKKNSKHNSRLYTGAVAIQVNTILARNVIVFWTIWIGFIFKYKLENYILCKK